MSVESRVVLLLVISLIHTGWIFDIEFEPTPMPARIVRPASGMGSGRCGSNFKPDEGQSHPKRDPRRLP
jgi:hypothetical protein